MKVDIIPISSLRLQKVQYYSVFLEGHDKLEFRDFQQRMSVGEKDKFELGEINRYIQKIGNRHGARPAHFRDEDAAEGLPPPYHQFLETNMFGDFGLRLYCIRLSPSIVILLNGDRKTTLKAQECANCRPHFERARRIAKQISQAILDGYIEIDEDKREMIIDRDFELFI